MLLTVDLGFLEGLKKAIKVGTSKIGNQRNIAGIYQESEGSRGSNVRGGVRVGWYKIR